MTKLYELTIGLESLWAQAAEIIDPEQAPDAEEQAKALSYLEKQLSELEGTHADKCLNLACLIKNLEADAAALKAEEEKLARRRKSAERQGEWLRQYLAGNMEPGTNLKDARAVIGWRKSTGVILLCKVEDLPESFKRTKTVVEADKTAIKDALSADPTHAELSGRAQVEQRFNIQIK